MAITGYYFMCLSTPIRLFSIPTKTSAALSEIYVGNIILVRFYTSGSYRVNAFEPMVTGYVRFGASSLASMLKCRPGAINSSKV